MGHRQLYLIVAWLATGQVACSSSSPGNGATGPSPCESDDAPAACGKSCVEYDDCSGATYCGIDEQCTADCTAGGSGCAAGYSCSSFGQCVADVAGRPCPDVLVSLTPVVPRVMLLIDQSGSMDEGFGRIAGQRVNRWEAVRYALTDPQAGAVTSLEQRVRFAATLYHSVNGFQNGGTCPILTRSQGSSTRPQLGARQAIDELLADNDPIQDTPTAEAVADVAKSMAAWTTGPDETPGPKILVIATDGNPDNCEDPDAHNQASQTMSEKAVQSAFDQGIRSYVLSVGSDVSEDHLARVANAGLGKPLDPPDAPFFRGNNPDELVTAFEQIIRGARSCSFTLDGTVATSEASSGTITLNGVQLEHGTDWTLVDERTVELLGDACDTFHDTDTVVLEARFPCGAVIL